VNDRDVSGLIQRLEVDAIVPTGVFPDTSNNGCHLATIAVIAGFSACAVSTSSRALQFRRRRT
jgi:hypothetical protein